MGEPEKERVRGRRAGEGGEGEDLTERGNPRSRKVRGHPDVKAKAPLPDLPANLNLEDLLFVHVMESLRSVPHEPLVDGEVNAR